MGFKEEIEMFFNWIGKIFVPVAVAGAKVVAAQELEKVHPEIAAQVRPLIDALTPDNKEETIQKLVVVAKVAGAAALEAYVAAQCPALEPAVVAAVSAAETQSINTSPQGTTK